MVPLLVAALLAAASPADTVYTVDGGRITGTVIEESPTAGVTIQTPDGVVRRVEHNQIARVEFADGTVSTPRAAPAPTPPAASPPPTVQPAVAARPPVVEGPLDNVYLTGGGRVRGTVMEENASSGIKVRLLDGSVRVFGADEITRIEYADGAVSTPRAPPPAPARPAEPAAPPRAKPTEAPIDNVYFTGGGRVRGTVIEENPRTGVKVRLLDGSIQTYSRDDLVRIEYADGSVSRRVTPTPAPVPAPRPAVAPQPAPVPPPPAVAQDRSQAFPLYLSLGVGATFLGGDAARGVAMSSFLQPQQAHVSGELGLRFTPSFAVGVYGDVGGGDPAEAVRARCATEQLDCAGTTGRAGILVRHTWEPLSRRPVWMSLGTGWEFGGVAANNANMNGMNGGNGEPNELFSYHGREYLRVGGGVDFRSNEVVALGLYGSIAFGEYDRYRDPTQTLSLERATHTTAQVGLRLTLFP